MIWAGFFVAERVRKFQTSAGLVFKAAAMEHRLGVAIGLGPAFKHQFHRSLEIGRAHV